MSKKFTPSEIIKPAAILFAICLVASALLGFTNSVTAERIEQLQIEKENSSRLLVLPDAESFDEKGDYCVGLGANGETVGYIFTVTEKGYGGDVKVMTGVDNDGKVTGVEILELSETAGLGMNAQKQSFRDAFKGLTAGITVSKNNPEGNQIKALTGATITSKAVTEAVNTALENYAQVKGGNDNG